MAGRYGYTSGCARPVACLCGNASSDGDPTGFKNPSPLHLKHTPLIFLLKFCLFVHFYRGLVQNLSLFCPLVLISLHSRYFFILFILFSVLLTVRILTLLGICFENMNCIFVISVVLGLCVLVLFWTVL
jgi:hypothetical protein